MDYKLAEKLKNSGFPQGVLDGISPESCYSRMNSEIYFGEPAVHFPLLTELIESCGEAIFSLTRHGDIWQTNFVDGMAGETAGHTPEEAVAELWIKLNEKSKVILDKSWDDVVGSKGL